MIQWVTCLGIFFPGQISAPKEVYPYTFNPSLEEVSSELSFVIEKVGAHIDRLIIENGKLLEDSSPIDSLPKKKKPAEGGRVSSVVPVSLKEGLQKGNHSSAVLALQERLSELGLYLGDLDSMFGDRTEQQLLVFKRQFNLLSFSGFKLNERNQALTGDTIRAINETLLKKYEFLNIIRSGAVYKYPHVEKRLPLMQTVFLEFMAELIRTFPGQRINDSVRTREEHCKIYTGHWRCIPDRKKGIPNSLHQYGLAVDLALNSQSREMHRWAERWGKKKGISVDALIHKGHPHIEMEISPQQLVLMTNARLRRQLKQISLGRRKTMSMVAVQGKK